jgi:hypothetical protein
VSLIELPGLVQGSDDWHDQRRGMVTASVVGRLITVSAPGGLDYDCPACAAAAGSACLSRTRKSPTPIKTMHDERATVAAERSNGAPPVLGVADNDTSRALVATLVAERITGWTEPSFTNDDMLRGILHEPVARERYAEHNGVEVSEVGFIVRDDWGFKIGASPDGLIGNDGGLEIKCPRAKGHIRTVIADEVPVQYMAQVQASLLVSGREWWDFVSFCAGLPMWTKRVLPDPEWYSVIIAAVDACEREISEMTAAYQARAEGLPLTERIPDDLEVVI